MLNRLGIIASLFVGALFAAEPTGDYKRVVDQFTILQHKYPAVSQIFSIGKNDDDVDIYALRISLTPTVVDPHKVGHLIVATHHGNETACPVFAGNLAEELLKKFVGRDLFRGNLAETEWTIIPVLNVSGFNNGQRYEHGNDPNRDYPDICTGAANGKLKSIRTLKEYMASRVFSGSLTVHGYVGSLTYPWGISTHDTHTLDHNEFDRITAKAAAINDYQYGTSTDVVYPANGSYEDYAYWKHGMWSLLLELKNGSDSDIRTTTTAMLAYFNELNASPSSQHEFKGQCNRGETMSYRLD